MTQITLLDGSIGQEIVKRSGDRPTHLWSTQVMIEKPGVVGAVHVDYFRAGATVATTNSYALHRDRLIKDDREDQLAELIDRSLSEAEKARDVHGAGRIAGALGPLAASYRPDICPPPEKARELYAELVDMMQQRVDLFLIETASSVMQARGALLGTAETDKPVWLGVSVSDNNGTQLRSGEPLEALAETLEEFSPDAVLVNCSTPEATGKALRVVRNFGFPFGAYANGFTHISDGFLGDKPTVDSLDARLDMGPKPYADFVMDWVDQGATIVGGCCEIGPDHIEHLAQRLRDAGHQIV